MCTKPHNLNVFHLVLQLSLPNPLQPVEIEDEVGAALTGDAPTTSEWSAIFLAKVWLILEVWQYLIYILVKYNIVLNNIQQHLKISFCWHFQ